MSRRRNPARILAAAFLLAALVLLLLSSPAPGHAQTADQLLLGNTGGTSSYGAVNVGSIDYTQPFTTGTNPTGYTLTRIQVGAGNLVGTTAPSASEITVTLRADSSGDPADSALATFSFPGTWTSEALNEFTLATAYDLDREKTYHIHITATKRVWVEGAAASQVDGGSASGWSFSAHSYLSAEDGWTAGSHGLTMELHGTIKATAPGAPTGLTATEGHHAVKLEWTAPDDGGSPITGYEYTIDDGATFVATGSTGRSLILDNLADGDFTLLVRAVNAVGEGDSSSAATSTVGPAELSIVGRVSPETIEGADAVFTLFATKPALSSSKPLNVSVLVSESEDMVASADEGAQTVSFAVGETSAVLLVPTMDDGAVESNSAVTVAIQTDADYTINANDVFSSGTVTVIDAETIPGAPTGLTATEGHNVVILEWTAPANDGGSPITQYQGRFSFGGTFPLVDLDASTSYTLLPSSFADGDYTVEVRAFNGVDLGRWSPPETFTMGPATVNVTGDGEVVEGADAAFTVRASKPVLSADRPLNVSVSVSESGDQVTSAHEGTRTVSFALDATTAALTVPTVGDNVFQGDSLVTVAVQPDSDYTVGPASSGRVWVADDEPDLRIGVALNGTTEQTKAGSTRLGHVRTFQEFKTGVHPGGYELHRIKVEGASKFGVFPSGLTATVRKYGPSGPVVATLRSPSSWTSGMNEFTAPTNTILSSQTSYVVHFSQSSAGYVRAGVNENFCVDNHAPDYDCYVGPDGWNRFDWPIRGVWHGAVGLEAGSSPWGKDGNALRFSIEGLPAGRSGQEPSPPEDFSAQPCERKYGNLSWTAPSGSPDRYEIRASGFSSHLFDNQNAQFLGNNIVFIHHTTETEYRHTARGGITYYTVRAVNANGPGMWSAIDQSNLWGDDDGGRSCEPASQQEAAEATPEATGLPVITGTVEAGETLTADTSGIADFWGLDNAVFTYQWLADGEELPGATSATHTLADADAGRAISVRVSFTDDSGNAGTLTSEARQPNTPATGAPAIRGKAKVWDTLTADVSGIMDDDGLDRAAFAYQWQADGTDLSGATGSSYTLAASDEGKAISVTVSFTDDAGHEESFTSTPTAAVVAAAEEDEEPTDRPHGLSAEASGGAVVLTWTAPVVDYVVSSYHILRHRPEQGEAEPLVYVDQTPNKDTSYTDTKVEPGVLYVYRVKAIVNWMGDLGEASDAAQIRVPATAQEQTANNPATGAPTITGKAQVGEALTADTSGIADDDGLDNAAFAYQWLADGADISGATNDTYTLADSDEGKAISVKVSFTDDAGNEEASTSAATDAVDAKPNSPATGEPTINGTAQVGETLTADASGIADADGLDNASFSYQWQANDSNISGATGSSYTLVDSDEGKAVSLTVSFTDDAGHDETLASAATDAVKAKPNSPATGAPTITGTAQVGETLSTETSGIADEDGLDNVAFSYQWQADGADISGATDSTYTLVDADEGKAISVTVSFTDDRGHGEELTSAATDAVAGLPSQPLTASLENTPSSHDGESVFTFELRFSEEFGISYKTLRDHAFTATGGTVKKAQRLEQGSNLGWRITVRPDGNGPVAITLPETTDCDAQGAICTEDGRKLSHSLELTVSGPGS